MCSHIDNSLTAAALSEHEGASTPSQ